MLQMCKDMWKLWSAVWLHQTVNNKLFCIELLDNILKQDNLCIEIYFRRQLLDRLMIFISIIDKFEIQTGNSIVQLITKIRQWLITPSMFSTFKKTICWFILINIFWWSRFLEEKELEEGKCTWQHFYCKYFDCKVLKTQEKCFVHQQPNNLEKKAIVPFLSLLCICFPLELWQKEKFSFIRLVPL